MRISLRQCKLFFAVCLVVTAITLPDIIWSADEKKNKSGNENIKKFSYFQQAIMQLEKIIFDRELGEKKQVSRMTWEGILSSDSIERKNCKQSCLDGYGLETLDDKGTPCDNSGWNKCMGLMDWGIFHWHHSCGGKNKIECEACWSRQTQGCYDKAFKKCINLCPE